MFKVLSIEMKGAAMQIEMGELLPVMVEYVSRHIVYQAVMLLS